MMMYDEHCFERINTELERSYLSRGLLREEREQALCVCEEEKCRQDAVIEIEGIYLCPVHALKCLSDFDEKDVLNAGGKERTVKEIRIQLN